MVRKKKLKKVTAEIVEDSDTIDGDKVKVQLENADISSFDNEADSDISEGDQAISQLSAMADVKDLKSFEVENDDLDVMTEKKLRPKESLSKSSHALVTQDPIALYLQEIRKYPLLTREQEQEVAKKYFDTKDPEAAQMLVTSNLRFVVKIAAEYSKFGGRMIDLIQEGNIGLLHAVKEFNPYKGVRLITYAVWWIRGYIQEYLMKQYSLVKIGTTQNQKKLFYRLQKEKQALDQWSDQGDYKRLSKKLGADEIEVRQMAERLSGRDLSLDISVDDRSGASHFLEFQKSSELAPDEQLGQAEQIFLLNKSIDELRPELTEKENILLNERMLSDEPLTLQQIADKYGITREAIRQAEARLLSKIKTKLTQTSND